MTTGGGEYIFPPPPPRHNPLDLFPLHIIHCFPLLSAIVFSPALPFYNKSRTQLFWQLVNDRGYWIYSTEKNEGNRANLKISRKITFKLSKTFEDSDQKWNTVNTAFMPQSLFRKFRQDSVHSPPCIAREERWIEVLKRSFEVTWDILLRTLHYENNAEWCVFKNNFKAETGISIFSNLVNTWKCLQTKKKIFPGFGYIEICIQ